MRKLLFIFLLLFVGCASNQAQYQKATTDITEEFERLINDARSMKNQKKFHEAIDLYSKALEIKSDKKAYIERGKIYIFMYQNLQKNLLYLNNGQCDFDAAIRLDPQYFEGYLYKGIVSFFFHGIDILAKENFTKAIELNPSNDQAYYLRGLANSSIGNLNIMREWEDEAIKNYNQAVVDYSKAIALNPNDSEYYEERGSAYDILKSYNKSIEDYNKAIQLDKKKADLLNEKILKIKQKSQFTNRNSQLDSERVHELTQKISELKKKRKQIEEQKIAKQREDEEQKIAKQKYFEDIRQNNPGYFETFTIVKGMQDNAISATTIAFDDCLKALKDQNISRRSIEWLTHKDFISKKYPGSQISCATLSGILIHNSITYEFRSGSCYKVSFKYNDGLDYDYSLDNIINVKISDTKNYIFINIDLNDPIKSVIGDCHLPILSETAILLFGSNNSIQIKTNVLSNMLNNIYKKSINPQKKDIVSFAASLILSPSTRELVLEQLKKHGNK